MALEATLEALRELGVYLPDDISSYDDAQLTKLAKNLNPWTVTIHPFNGQFVATTNNAWFMRQPKEGEEAGEAWKDGQSAAGASTPAYAAFLLLYQQLQHKRYSVQDTFLKTNAAQRAARVNPQS